MVVKGTHPQCFVFLVFKVAVLNSIRKFPWRTVFLFEIKLNRKVRQRHTGKICSRKFAHVTENVLIKLRMLRTQNVDLL